MATETLFAFLITLAVFGLSAGSAEAQSLSVGFYSKTCPSAEAIVFEEVSHILDLVPSLAAPLLRMHFHDCFVRVCSCSTNRKFDYISDRK